jgi:hypothetical protein
MNVIIHTPSHGDEGEVTGVKFEKVPKHLWNLDATHQVAGGSSEAHSARSSGRVGSARLISRLGQLTDKSKRKRLRDNTNLSTQIAYHLVKHYFLRTFFPRYLSIPPMDRIEFVAYVEVVVSFGITKCFNIGVREWFCLLIVTIPVVVDIKLGNMTIRNYETYTTMCVVLLITAMVATRWLALIFNKVRPASHTQSSCSHLTHRELMLTSHTHTELMLTSHTSHL